MHDGKGLVGIIVGMEKRPREIRILVLLILEIRMAGFKISWTDWLT